MHHFTFRTFFAGLAFFTFTVLLTGAAAVPVATAGETSSFTVYNCKNSDDGVDTFSYNLNDEEKTFSYDSGSVSQGGSRTFSCEGEGGCQVQYGSLFGDDVWEEVSDGAKRHVLSKASGFLGFVATIYVGGSSSVCAK